MLSKLKTISGKNEEAILIYAKLWTFEKWLREMVYVELKVKKGRDWINLCKPQCAYENDKKYTHMSTPESNPLSYMTLGELRKLIINNWEVFSPYLPPQDLWKGKIEEISNIRNRIAHFRLPNSNDLERLNLFLKDIDHGFWSFCASYNDYGSYSEDSEIAKNFYDLDPNNMNHDKFQSAAYGVSIGISKRLWANSTENITDASNCLLHLSIMTMNRRHFEYPLFLNRVVHLSSDIVHISLSDLSDGIRVTIPVKNGTKENISLIKELIDHAVYSIRLSHIENVEENSLYVQRLSKKYPEYILGPDNPLTFLSSDCPCSFFGV